MVNRLVSLTALLCLAGVVLFGKLIPSSPLFSFVSSNKWVALARLILVGAMIWLSFKGYITNLKMRRYVWLTGLWLISIGLAMIMATQINGLLFDYFKPLDLLLLIE